MAVVLVVTRVRVRPRPAGTAVQAFAVATATSRFIIHYSPLQCFTRQAADKQQYFQQQQPTAQNKSTTAGLLNLRVSLSVSSLQRSALSRSATLPNSAVLGELTLPPTPPHWTPPPPPPPLRPEHRTRAARSPVERSWCLCDAHCARRLESVTEEVNCR